MYFLPHGQFVYTRPCPFCLTDGHAPDECFALANPIRLVMNTAVFTVIPQVLYFSLRRSKKMPANPTYKESNTVILLLHLCFSIYNGGQVVLLGSGFCVLRGILELRNLENLLQ